MGGGEEVELAMENSLHAGVGDVVEISISDSAMLKAVFVIYMVPVIGLIAGALIGQNLAPSVSMDPTTLSPLLGFAFLGVALLAVRIIGRRLGKLRQYLPRMVRIVKKSEPCPN